jgi:TetR/AcrR family transcriptional regulator, transcriptional repressor of aconitase
MTEENYARQRATYRTTQESIILAAKKMMGQQGFRAINMIELASEAEVSRATLYNHFRDKEAIGYALLQYELEGVLSFLGTPQDFLINFATAISQSEVLNALRQYDRELIPTIFMPNSDQLWVQVGESLKHRLGEKAPIAFIWLIGQALAPLSVESIKAQVGQMLESTLF